jgi:replication factor C small subunit
MAIEKLWVEKYRPHNIEDYVWRDEDQKNQVMKWINAKSIPHILLSGSAGTGKTTLAKVLVKALDIDTYDFLQINASRDNGIDYIRDKLEGFVQTMPFGTFKVVLLDEADYLTHNAQSVMRGLMEAYSETARFILTCNFPNKIITPLHSRCQGFHIEKLDRIEFTARVATILIEENMIFDMEVLDSYVTETYPDLRKCLNSIQAACINGELQRPNVDSKATSDYKTAVVELFKEGRVRDARKLLCSQVRPDEIDDIFRWMYDNLELWGDTPEKQDKAIVIIRNGLINHSMVADTEINLSATLIELTDI